MEVEAGSGTHVKRKRVYAVKSGRASKSAALSGEVKNHARCFPLRMYCSNSMRSTDRSSPKVREINAWKEVYARMTPSIVSTDGLISWL